MTPKQYDEWLARLRAPKTKRCFNAFRLGDSFCPLGLALDITAPEGWTQPQPGDLTYRHLAFGPRKPGSYNPIKSVVDFLGLPPEAKDIAILNDGGTLSLEEIADWIEDHIGPPNLENQP